MTMDQATIRARARELMRVRPGYCYQRAIRDVLATLESTPNPAPTSMAGAYVTPISRAQAQEVILKYEWLGTLGRAQACYGLWFDVGGAPTIAGVVCFGLPAGIQASYICGKEYAKKAMALERGACVHWAPKNAASWFIPRAIRMAARDHGWRIFYAYSDPAAGEIGTIYQALSWMYLGIGPGHGKKRELWTRPDGSQVSSRTLRAQGLKSTEAKALGWKRETVPARGKYVWIEAGHKLKKELRSKMTHPTQPYPKREAQ